MLLRCSLTPCTAVLSCSVLSQLSSVKIRTSPLKRITNSGISQCSFVSMRIASSYTRGPTNCQKASTMSRPTDLLFAVVKSMSYMQFIWRNYIACLDPRQILRSQFFPTLCIIVCFVSDQVYPHVITFNVLVLLRQVSSSSTKQILSHSATLRWLEFATHIQWLR